MASRDQVLAASIASLPWVLDGIAEDERWALRYIKDIHAAEHSLGERLAAFPWVSDDIIDDERWALRYIRDIHALEPSLGKRLAAFPWVNDGITDDERWSTQYLSNLAGHSLPLGTRVTEFAWLADDLVKPERNALQNIAALASRDLPAALVVAEYPWMADDILDAEWNLMGDLVALADAHTALAGTVTGFSWMADGITDDERWAVGSLRNLAEKEASVALQVAAMPFLTASVDTRDWHALSSMVTLSGSAAGLALLTEQGWFQAGLDDDEAAFVSVLADLADRSPGECRDMVVTHYIQSATVSLPLAGDIQLVAFRATPFQANNDLMDQVANAVRAMEGLMGVPFPRREVIVLFVDPMYAPGDPNSVIVALNVGTHMVVTRPEVTRGEYRQTVAHEVAHYYWGIGDAPLWFREGGSDFLASYALDQSGWRSLATRRINVSSDEVRYCSLNGIEDIQKLNDLLALQGYAAHAATAYFICNYYLGEYLLLNLYQTMGPEASSNAWNQLYLLAEGEDRQLTEDEIYQAFLRNTPASELDEVKSMYDQWHGGDLVE
ncbi:MAG: hypothetical protein BZY88_06265 [SAR202 cluster bacterium Io17-Chloro-G9]|nr:MAG: hypothetical protein BZY88_06265 [SAR202 cluster bacterium Io17-Chloro-G9]